MTKLEKTVEALRRCIPAAEFEKAMAEVEETEAKTVTPAHDIEKLTQELLTELGTPGHIKGHRYMVTALRMIVDDPTVLDVVTSELYPGVAVVHNTTGPRVERAIRHAIEITWDRIDPDDMRRYFGNTVSPEKGKPTNSEFLSRVGNIVRQRAKEV